MSATSFFCVINASNRREKVTTRVREIEFDPFLDKISLNWIFRVFFAFISRYVMQFFLAFSEINSLIKRIYQGPITKFQWDIALLANNVDFFATHRFGKNSTYELVLFLQEFLVWQYSVNIRATYTIPTIHNI